ncbi:glycosyltransferase involved in cell wall biosynthesis [Caldalkalibacillus uzonensis]|uniref:Glycosyltransferase involved in cell wall biosynthesis n=1 Tax=Caldalkalibacillus uzonensis TaxID=353224 RepID=A0ABU0CTZ2_9BACI|nr:glycosyltransferase family A protein [Caldalkalibacillus uzonensis]MDQ0339892.1 glycosyltransferase involved in cell wall biosynthesis [Caldalkalibacillus uzonensis]
METILLWLLAAYGGATGCLSVLKWWYGRFRPPRVDYYILTYNSAQQIEWMIRSYTHLSRIEGREFRFVIIDFGSLDDTLAIIDKFKRKGIQIELLTQVEEPLEQVVEFHSHSVCCQEHRGKEMKVVDLRRRHCLCEYKTS